MLRSKYYKRIKKIPKVQKYLARRPKTKKVKAQIRGVAGNFKIDYAK